MNTIRKLFNISLVSLLVISLIPSSIGADGKQSVEGTYLFIEMTDDITLELNEERFGEIKAGTFLFVQELDGKYQIQLAEELVEVYQNNAEVFESEHDDLFVEYREDEIIGFITSDTTIEMNSKYDDLFGQITLNENTKYPVIGVSDDSYEVVLGNRLFQIQKDYHVIFQSNEKELEKSTKSLSVDVGSQKIEEVSEKVSEDNPSLIKSIPQTNKVNKNYVNTNFGNYFQVINDEAIVYDNRTGKLVKIGKLVKGETYPIVSDYGNWHRIQFGNIYGYVHKQNIDRGNVNTIKNLNRNYKQSTEKFVAKRTTVVYDNSSSKLVPFAEIDKGQVYPIVSDYGNWYRVLLSGRVGYVKKSDVNGYFNKTSKYFEVTEEGLPVYDNRSGSLKKIGELKKGQVYERVSDYGNWHRIQFGKIYGYVRKDSTLVSTRNKVPNLNTRYKHSNLSFITKKRAVVYDNTSGKLVPFATLEKGQSYPIVSDYGNWYRIIVSNKIGYIHKNDVNLNFNNSIKYFEVTTDNLPIYDNRSGSLKKIGELTKGQVYERVSDYGNWHRIQFGKIYGYVRKDDTVVSTRNKVPNLNNRYTHSKLSFTTNKKAVVYDNTSGKLIPFATLERGVSYPIASDYGNWYRVIVSNKVGYVHKNDVNIEFNNNMRYFKVIEDNLPIYDNRSGSLVKVGSLKKGQVYERVSDYGNWHRIQFGNYYGYVRKSGTEVALTSTYSNRVKTTGNIGTLTPKKNVEVYDNTSGTLIPYATVDHGKTYPVIRDYGQWYEVNLAGRYGYVRKSDVSANVMIAKNIVNPRQEYTYDHLVTNINQFSRTYPGLISWKTIGKSVDGRNIYAIKLGKGKKEITINAAHHAREWLTTNLVMEMLDEYSQAYVRNQTYGGYNVRKILDEVSIWFVPMVNPDGVTLVQKGAFSAKNSAVVLRMNGGNTNFSAWKANIRGIDLNRQYPTGWDSIKNAAPRPGPQNYKGTAPLTEPEVRAMFNFTRAHNFKTSVSYHSSGEILYWDYKLNGSLKTLSRNIANRISTKTGYELVFPGINPSGGGYKDWFITTMKQPGFTPEISPYVGPRPVPISNFDSIWQKNDTIGLMLAQEASNR